MWPRRSLSAQQEVAQLLCGQAMPKTLLGSLLCGTETGRDVALLNLTPYDAHLETTVLQWGQHDPSRLWRSLSISTDHTVVEFSERHCGMLLFEERSFKTDLNQKDETKKMKQHVF